MCERGWESDHFEEEEEEEEAQFSVAIVVIVVVRNKSTDRNDKRER